VEDLIFYKIFYVWLTELGVVFSTAQTTEIWF